MTRSAHDLASNLDAGQAAFGGIIARDVPPEPRRLSLRKRLCALLWYPA